MMLAAKYDNEIPYDRAYIHRVAFLHTEPDFAPLVEVGFLEIGPSSKTLAAASNALVLAAARPETEAEKRREESEAEKNHAGGWGPKPKPGKVNGKSNGEVRAIDKLRELGGWKAI